MDFSKFVDLLESETLFFARADRLGDPFEGTYPFGNYVRHIATGKPADSLDQLRLLLNQDPSLFDHVKWRRPWTYVNCWHMNPYESAAMWRLYAKSDEAIAVRSSFAKLQSVLAEDTFLGTVQYIDFEKDRVEEDLFFNAFVHKRQAFAHEREVRALFTRWPYRACGPRTHDDPPAVGVPRRIDLGALVDAIVIAPGSPTWIFPLVSRLARRLQLSVPVLRSSLEDQPFP